MSRFILKYCNRLFVLSFFFALSAVGYAANYTSVSSGNWATSTTWSPAGVPASGDNVTINSGHTVTYTGNLTWSGGTVTLNGTGKLVFTGNFTYSGGTFNFSQTSDFQVGGSFIVDWSKNCSVGGNLIVSGDVDNRGMLTVGGNLTSQNGGILNENSRQITIAGNLTAKTYIVNQGTFVVPGDVTVSNGYFTNGDSWTFNIGKSLNTSGDIDNKGTLTVGGNLTSQNGGILNEDLRQITIVGNLTAKTYIVNKGTFVVPGDVTVSNGYFTNEWSRNFSIGKSLSATGAITNQGTLNIVTNCTSTGGEIINEWSHDFTIGGDMSAYSGLTNRGTLQIPGNLTVVNGGVVNEDPDHLIHVGMNASVNGDFSNKGIVDIDGNFVMPSGNLYLLNQAILAIDGNITKTGNINVDNSDLIIGGNLNSNGGTATVNQYNGDFYVFGDISTSTPQAGCTNTCFPKDQPCPDCGIKSGTQWIAESSPGNPYISYSPISSWWENHLANIGESNGPAIVCPASSSTFQVTAVTSDAGSISSNTFEWAVYGGTIASFYGNSISTHTGTVNSHTASYQSVHGVNGTTQYTLNVQWEAANFSDAYVAVRQTSANSCSDGKWSIFYINIQNTAAPTGSSTQSFCFASNPTVANLTATGTGIQWYSSPSGGTALTQSTAIVGGNYYASQMAGSCESATRFAVAVTIINDLVWTGAVDTDWNTPGNWGCNVIPNLTTNVLIPNVANKPILQSGALGAAKNIVIDSGSSLTVISNILQIAGTITNSGAFTATAGTIEMKGSSAQTIPANTFSTNTIQNLIANNSLGVTLAGDLNITGILKSNSGGLDISTGKFLTLVSTATQTALIDGSGNGSVTGNVTMQRYLPSAFGYKYFSSPFQDATVSAFSSYVDLGASFPTFYKYDEENHRDSLGFNAYQSGWVKYLAGTLSPMSGYAANFGPATPAKTVSITGTVSIGSMSIPLFNHNRKYTKGFNLAGNPYPSPIDWNKAGWTKSNIDNAIYFFNAGNTDQYTGVYSSYVNGVSTGDADNHIASMQGFFVHVTDGTYPVSATLGLSNSTRTTDLNPLFKRAIIDNRTILRFTANFETKNAIPDVAVVYFDDQASRSFDKDLDALKMLNTDLLVPNLYTLSPDPTQLSINGMPTPADSITKIPVGVTTLSDGWINFNAKEISQLPTSMHIYLVDAEQGVTQDLKQQPGYRFYLKAGVYNQRFTLVFSLSAIGEPTVAIEKMFTVVRSANLLLVKVNLPLNTKGIIMVTNMSGQQLLRKEVFEKESVEINPQAGSGVYVVTMISGKRMQSEKILIRKDYE